MTTTTSRFEPDDRASGDSELVPPAEAARLDGELRGYIEAAGRDLAAQLSELLEHYRIVVMGGLVSDRGGDPSPAAEEFLRAFAESLPALAAAGLTTVGVLVDSRAQTQIDALSVETLAELAPLGGQYLIAPTTLQLIGAARLHGLRVLAIGVPETTSPEFRPEDYARQTDAARGRVGELRATDRILIAASNLDAVRVPLPLPGDVTLTPLAAALELDFTGAVRSLRLADTPTAREVVAREFAAAGRSKLTPVVVPNEYPASASGGDNLVSLSTDYAVFMVNRQ